MASRLWAVPASGPARDRDAIHMCTTIDFCPGIASGKYAYLDVGNNAYIT